MVFCCFNMLFEDCFLVGIFRLVKENVCYIVEVKGIYGGGKEEKEKYGVIELVFFFYENNVVFY